MAERNYTAGGFSFTDEKLAEQAKKEMEGIKYVKERVDMENPEMTLEIYHRMISENLFETPVGLCFLKELQDALRTNPRTRTGVIKDIPIGKSSAMRVESEQKQKSEKRETKPEKQVIRKEKHINYKRRYRMFMAVSLGLFVIVLSMFAIAFTSNSPQILNYENEIINKYEEWERQLEEREEELNKREKELQQDLSIEHTLDDKSGIIGL